MASINLYLLNELIDGCNRLTPESRDAVVSYIKSKEVPTGGFMDKAGNADVYYTFFGLTCSLALGLEVNNQHKSFLCNLAKEGLDLPDQAACSQSATLLKLFELPKLMRMKIGAIGARIGNLIEYPKYFSGKPLTDSSTPYIVYLTMLATNMTEDNPELLKWVNTYSSGFKTESGGWSNVGKNGEPSLNATTSALMVLKQVGGYADLAAIEWLMKQQNLSGGFVAFPGSPLPDLLSTTTALVALKAWNEQPTHRVIDFIHSHWRTDGGFAATFLDETTDVEYTFYGLLALGASSK